MMIKAQKILTLILAIDINQLSRVIYKMGFSKMNLIIKRKRAKPTKSYLRKTLWID